MTAEPTPDDYRAVWARRLAEVQELAAERPAHARYLAALLETDPAQPWTLDTVPHGPKVSARIADALREDACTYRPTDGRDARQWPPLRPAYVDVRVLAEAERDPEQIARRRRENDPFAARLFRSYRIPQGRARDRER